MKSIFLSHSSEDKEFVRELHKFLKANGIKSWIDEAEIKIGDSLIQKISEGIELADYVAIVLSPHSMKSPWVEKELEIAITDEIEGRKKVVLPILIEKCDIPNYLNGKKYGDFRTNSKSISGMSELLEILKDENGETENNKDALLSKNDSQGVHQRFLEVYGELTESDILSSPRFQRHVAKKIAEEFCTKSNYPKFHDFMTIFDELTESDILSSPRFSKKDALEIALKRVGVFMDLSFEYVV